MSHLAALDAALSIVDGNMAPPRSAAALLAAPIVRPSHCELCGNRLDAAIINNCTEVRCPARESRAA